MQVNFFGWLREGVKQSVMLGVSDAVEQLGAPNDETTHRQLLAALRETTSATTASKRSGGPRRLGRTLKDLSEPADRGETS